MNKQYSLLLTQHGKYVNVKTKSTFSFSEEKVKMTLGELLFGIRATTGLVITSSEKDDSRYVSRYQNSFLNYSVRDDQFFFSYEQEDLLDTVYAVLSLELISDYLYAEFGIIVSDY